MHFQGRLGPSSEYKNHLQFQVRYSLHLQQLQQSQVQSTQTLTFQLKMNSFKTILALCVVMAASCSASSYRTQQSAWGSQPAAAAPLNGGGYGNKVWGSAPSASVQPTFSAPAVQDAPLAPAPAPAQSSFPATTQQICTCVAVPAAAAQQSAAPAPAAAAPLADVPLQQAAPQTYSAPAAAPQQTWSAPAAAPAPVAAAATQFYSAPVQQAAAPAPVFRPAPSAAARPSYSTGY